MRRSRLSLTSQVVKFVHPVEVRTIMLYKEKGSTFKTIRHSCGLRVDSILLLTAVS